MEIRTNLACMVFLLGNIVALGQTANMDQGSVVGITYTNRFFGLTFSQKAITSLCVLPLRMRGLSHSELTCAASTLWKSLLVIERDSYFVQVRR